MDTQLTVWQDRQALIGVVLDGVTSRHTKRAYARALDDFITWFENGGGSELNKATVQRYATELRDAGVGPSSINQRLSAIRKLALEAADNGKLDAQIANGVKSVKGVKQEGRRSGNWLTRRQAQQLLDAPDITTLKGLRDRALLAVLLGCGLRRQELAALSFGHIQQRDGRWVIVDLVGKRGKVRSVPMPSWCKSAIDEWASALAMSDGYLDAVDTGYVFRPLTKGGRLAGGFINPQTVHDIVSEYSEALGLGIAPHDLRRTFAKLAHKGGSGLDQIQLSLGHASIQTTERYLGVEQNLTDAPCDRLGLH
jgi:integrase/recombinase XerD